MWPWLFCVRCIVSPIPHKYKHSPSIMMKEEFKKGWDKGWEKEALELHKELNMEMVKMLREEEDRSGQREVD